jgi:hypothetical protein
VETPLKRFVFVFASSRDIGSAGLSGLCPSRATSRSRSPGRRRTERRLRGQAARLETSR